MRTLTVPELSLVVLVGTAGSGKSTFAARHFAATQVLSSDYCRGLVSDDENDQSASADAFELLHHIAGVRLRRGLLTVIDATNVQPKAREALVAVARAHDVLPVAIVLDVPEEVCRGRNAVRPDRSMGPQVISRQRREMRANLRNLEREGFRKVHILRGVVEIDDAVFEFEKAYSDKRELTGPFDVIGDIHGCRSELETLPTVLGYELIVDASGRAVDAVPPESRTAVFVGDLVDRGPDTPGVLRLVMGMVEAGHAVCVPRNHESKLVRALSGRKLQLKHGIVESLEQLSRESAEFRARVVEFCRGLVSHHVRDGRRIVQPGVKCRGPEYLRIIYGPEYLEERNLERLRRRSPGRKQSLALREYALGLESLERFVAGEALYRVHEAVFAVLALESEPVDPRL